MKSLFASLLNEIESRWSGSRVDIITYQSNDIYFITLNGHQDRFIQLSIAAEQIEIISKVIDLNKPVNSLFEFMQIDSKRIFKRSQGVEFHVDDISHVVDQIDKVLSQLASVFKT